jgi:hypothetical protein
MIRVCLLLTVWLWATAALGARRQLQGQGRSLIEVEYALDDKATNQTGHVIVTYWISDKGCGMTRDVYDWAVQGGFTTDANAQEKANKCRELIRALPQPQNLPDLESHIVTAKCLGPPEAILRRFPIDRVPSAIREVLLLTEQVKTNETGDVTELPYTNALARLTFIQESKPLGSTNQIAPRH